MLTEIAITLSKSQIAKIKKVAQDVEAPLRIRLSKDQVSSDAGEHKIFLGVRNLDRVTKAREKGKGTIVEFTKEEKEQNMKQGGFLGAILGALSNPIVSALAAPLIGSVAGKAIDFFTGGKKEAAPAPVAEAPVRRVPTRRVVEDDDDDDDVVTDITMPAKSKKKGGLLFTSDMEGRGVKKIPPPPTLFFTT